MATRKSKEIDTTGKNQCSRCKVWKLNDEFSPKKKDSKVDQESKVETKVELKKYCNHCLGVATAYRNKKKIVRVNIHNLSDEEKKEIFEEVNNISE